MGYVFEDTRNFYFRNVLADSRLDVKSPHVPLLETDNKTNPNYYPNGM